MLSSALSKLSADPLFPLLLQNIDLAQKVSAIAKGKGCTPGQLALAWVLARGPDVIPIPGTKRIKCKCQRGAP